MKKFLIYSIILVIIVIIILLGIFFTIKNREDKSMKTIAQNNQEEYVAEYEESRKLEKSEYNNIVTAMQTYLNYLNINNTSFYNNEGIRIISEEEQNKIILSLLSERYIEDNQITLNNITEYLDNIDEQVVFIPLNVQIVEDNDITTYIVEGLVENLDYEVLYQKSYIVNIEKRTLRFSIEPSEQEFEDLVNVTTGISTIEEGNYNKIVSKQVSNESIATEYFSRFKRITLSSPELAYQYLNVDYREKRYGDFNTYEKYITDNREEIKGIVCEQYMVNQYSDYTEYVCRDQNGNTYIFNEDNIMNFDVKLDTYTIISDNFKETYDSSNEQYKVAMNIDKWVQMLNNRDYTHAYEVLDETFRNNNWGSEEAFEQYMRENFPLHYDVEYTTYSSEGTTYVQQINLTDITGETEGTISLNVIMQLKDNYEFVMSFSVQE